MKSALFLSSLYLPFLLIACGKESEPVLAPEAPPASVAPKAPVTQEILPSKVAQPTSEPQPQRNPAPPSGSPATKILPLNRILQIVRQDTPGEVLEVEQDDDDDMEIYEVTILTPDDRKIEIKLNAYTGTIIERDED